MVNKQQVGVLTCVPRKTRKTVDLALDLSLFVSDSRPIKL